MRLASALSTLALLAVGGLLGQQLWQRWAHAPSRQAVPPASVHRSATPRPKPTASFSPTPASAQASSTATPTPIPSLGPSASPTASAASATPSQPLPAALLQTRQWQYAVSSSYLLGANIAKAELHYQPTAPHYQARLQVRIAKQNLFDMHAQGRITATGLEPLRYQERGLAKDGSVLRQGDTLQWPEREREYPAPVGVTDSVSQHLQLLHELQNGIFPPKAGSHRELWLMRPEGLFHWSYDIQQLEQLDLGGPYGRVAAWHIVPRALGNGTTQSELWFAPSLGWAPVRIKMRWPDGSWLELSLL